jgi:hypothetical protein
MYSRVDISIKGHLAHRAVILLSSQTIILRPTFQLICLSSAMTSRPLNDEEVLSEMNKMVDFFLRFALL